MLGFKSGALWLAKALIGSALTIGAAVLALLFTSPIQEFLKIPSEVHVIAKGVDDLRADVSDLKVLYRSIESRLEAIDKIHLRLMGGFNRIYVGILDEEGAARFDLSREDVVIVESRRNPLLNPEEDEQGTRSGIEGHRRAKINDYILVRNETNNLTVIIVQRIKTFNRSHSDLKKDVDIWMTKDAASRLGIPSEGHPIEVRLMADEEVQMIRAHAIDDVLDSTVVDKAPSAAADPIN